MPSLLPGFEYDIFISYRQKDNKGDRWVTKFVDALRTELESTFKEDISIYFDENPHDGLLETHHVDKSLEGKLRCLVFIPIISQTYCDSKSFAWQQEFCAFNKLSQQDMLGRDIKLGNGNVASRILPVRIHSLDASDQKVFETELGSVLRAVEFIYKEPGVNRPLGPDDDPADNLNKTKYRNQVNKVANAVKEIISGISSVGKLPKDPIPEGRLESATGSPNKSIVVMPFEDLSQQKDQEYFCDGLSEEIIASLSRIKSLRVLSRTSSMHYKGAKKPLAQITQELGVKYLLEGSVRKDGSAVKITAQLIEAERDTHLWSDKYNGTLDDIFDIQEKIAEEIVRALRVQLTDEEDHGLRKRPTTSTEAHDLYLKGNHFLWLTTPESINKAIGYFEKALEIDEKLALAYAGLAMAYNGAAWFEYLDPQDAFSKAREYASRAVELDDALAEAHSCLGYNFCLDWKVTLAEQHLKRACELKPSFADAHLYYAWYLGGQGKTQEAFHEMNLALQLDPRSLLINANASFPNYWMKRYDLAIEQCLNTLKMEPTFYLAHWFLGINYIQAGAHEKAIAAFEKAITFSGGGPYYKAWLGHAYAAAGHQAKAVTLLEELTQLSTPKKSFSYQIIIVHLGLGNLKEAMGWLEIAYSERAPLLWYLKIDPYLDPLRSNPRFNEMLQGMGLPTEAVVRRDKTIIVLPFEDMSPEKDQEYFCDGLSEELINALAKIKNIRVVARTSAFSFKGKERDVRKIGKKLNVESLLEGSLRKAGNQLRITVQLINVADGFPLWSERYDREVSDVFAIQDEITLKIVDSLRLHLTSEERAGLSRDAVDPRIYTCYLLARSNMLRFTEEGIREGISIATRGIDAYGEHALLLAILGDAYARLVNVVTFGQAELLDHARRYAKRLAHLDPKSGRRHYINGFVDLMMGDIQGAVTSLKDSLDQDPQDPDTLFWLIEAYGMSGHPMAARPLAAKLAEVDPLTPSHRSLSGWVELTDGKFAVALGPFREWYEQAPDNPYVRWCFALVLSLNERKAEATTLFEQIIKDSPTTFWAAFAKLQHAAFIGDRDLANASATADLVTALRHISFYSWVVADAYSVLGEREKAMEWLEHAVERGFINFPLLNRYDPLLAPLRGDARFVRLMETVRTRWEAFEA